MKHDGDLDHLAGVDGVVVFWVIACAILLVFNIWVFLDWLGEAWTAMMM